MGLTEQMAYEALGVTPESAKTPETAEPAQGQEPETPTPEGSQKPDPEGGKAPEVAAPAEVGKEQPDQPAPEEAPKAGLTEEQRRENAARRREAERQAAIDKAVEDALKAEREKTAEEWKTFFRRADLKNPDTGEAITTREQFDAWAKTFGGPGAEEMTPEDLEKAIAESPAMKRVEKLLQQQEEEKKAAAEAAAKAQIDAELKKIHELDPTINTLEDLTRIPEAEEFAAYVDKGNTFLDAFYLATRGRQLRQAVDQGKQKGINSARSKEHLTPIGGAKGKGAVTVPKKIMDLYHALVPNATDAEIQAHYNKLHKD